MKSVLLILALFSFHSWGMNKVPLVSGKLYIPQGYDDNDLVEITVLGSLPDSCYRSPTYEIEKVGKTFNIFLYAYLVPEEKGCKKFSIPYQTTINLGLLEKGHYTIKLKGIERDSNKILKVVGAATSLQDDFQYGNIMNVIEDEDSRVIELVGTNPTNCLSFERVDTDIQSEVVILRPHFREQGECREEPTQFRIQYEVPFLAKHPRGILLHIRVMGGRSLNYLFKNKI
jgi:hypothetical protein